MFYLSFLNQTVASHHQPIFEILYFLEVILIISFLVAFIPLSIGVFNATPLHLNIRCYLLTWILHGFFASLGRFPLIVDQIWGIRQNAQGLLMVSSVSREVLYAYSSVLYERQGASTFLVFLVLGGIVETYSMTTGIFVVREVYSIHFHLVLMATGGCVGFMCFWLVLRLNRRLHNRFRPHYFGYSDYCIARSYQTNENVLVLEVLLKISIDTAYYTIPPFVLFLFYLLVPSGIGLDLWRSLAVAVYDLFIALFAIITPIRLIFSDIRFERGMRSMPVIDRIYSILRRRTAKVQEDTLSGNASNDETIQYFAQLNVAWKSEKRITIDI